MHHQAYTPHLMPATYWGWAINPKRSALNNLNDGIRFFRETYGGDVLSVRMRSHLADQLPDDVGIEVIVDEQVSFGTMLFVREEATR